ncbi:amidohydrolase [Alteromonas gilva]|uniref:Amidohydrolase n=1 Tax=Alteromonas gilva TaxID=2987522 RepID=A0ABT5L5F0_9ALTE|nr:amidohydrolase [Alteromonas gilva]MDC8832270.1 amidohydrolase [Alteromonas gilva]
MTLNNTYKKITSLFSALLLTLSVHSVTNAATLFTNVKGYTLDNQGQLLTFHSLLIDNGKVVSLDPDTVPGNVDRIDGHNKVLLPGLIDAHGHLLGLGGNLLEVDLRASSTMQEAAQWVAQYAMGHADQEWIKGRGWNQELWSDRSFPSAAVLDEVISNKPVWLTRVDGHAAWVNSKALDMAGITADTPDPTGGQIIRDADGNPTGVLIDRAMDLVGDIMPKQSSKLYQAQLNAAGEHLLSVGITAMHDAGIGHHVYDFYLARAAEQQLPVRIYAMLSATDPTLPEMLDTGIIRSNDDFLYIRSVKAYGDGALGSRGAALLKPYSDAPHQHGLLLTQPEDFPALFQQVLGNGFQLNFHAIGDRANRMVLDEFERTFSTVGGQSLRNRVEHAQVIDVNDLSRFAELDVLPSMQPTHATSDKNMAEDRIGKARMEGAYAWKTLIDSGIALPLGSDFPVELANPFYGLHAAVTRQDRDNQPVKGWYPEQALSIEQAFKGFTLDAAYAAHMEDSLGGLTPGKWADFILVDQDIFSVPAQDIWKTQVIQTWLAGEKVFDANTTTK